MQRHQNRDCREEAGRDIDDRITESRWAAGLGAVDRHQPNHRLQDRVVARKTAKRPISPETGNTAVYQAGEALRDRKSTRLNSSHQIISYAVFCLKKKNKKTSQQQHAHY